MLWRRRYYHRFTLAELEIRREKRALIVQRALRLFAIVLALCLTMLLSLVCFKPWKDLRSLEHERSFLQAHLEKSRERRSTLAGVPVLKRIRRIPAACKDSDNLSAERSPIGPLLYVFSPIMTLPRK